MKTRRFQFDISTKFAAAHGAKFAIPGQRKCRLICNAFIIDSSITDYLQRHFKMSKQRDSFNSHLKGKLNVY